MEIQLPETPLIGATSKFGQRVSVHRAMKCTRTKLTVVLLKSLGGAGLARVVPLVLEDWEFARVDLNCHMALKLLCQKEGCM